MGFLDKLFGRKTDDAAEGMQSAPPPASMPGDTAPPAPADAAPAETEHEHGEHDDHQH